MREGYIEVLERVTSAIEPSKDDLIYLLETKDTKEYTILSQAACDIRDIYCGKRMAIRGLVEFSSFCKNTCKYCGLNRYNKTASPYRLNPDEIIKLADHVYTAGFHTIVLQSGEDGYPAQEIAKIITSIKVKFNIAITLSVGERSFEDYQLWKEAGADRYLLRIETKDRLLYKSLHQGRNVETRLQALKDLQSLGYQTGSGIMIGSPGQTIEHIANDILFLTKEAFDMIGIGPFIPHEKTPFARYPKGPVQLTLNTLALLRICTKNTWIPATTALGSLERDYRLDALMAGANVVMPNFSPESIKKKYEIYPNKSCVKEKEESVHMLCKNLASKAGLEIDYARCDSLKVT